jgi:disulfide bond formation protein DsbB
MSALFTLRTTSLLIALSALLILAGAWFIEIVLGVKPCPLCLEQRIPYYIGIPIAALGFITAQTRPHLSRIVLGLTLIIFAISAGLGFYHTGVEEGLWQGPAGCSGNAITQAPALNDFLKSLDQTRVIRCDEVAMRIAGLSLAAWNGLISSAFALYALITVVRPR